MGEKRKMIKRTEQEIMQNWKGDINTPIVSVCTTTYNHELFIAEAIESFLMQETNFPFELVIDEDCSTDSTANVILKYAKEYPNIIKANIRQKNVGAKINWIEGLRRAKGKHIALCEGDDYWTDPLKLQKQVGFLTGNQSYFACFHDCIQVYDEGKDNAIQQLKIGNRKIETEVDLLSIIEENNIATASILYRNTIKDIPNFFTQSSKGDYSLMVIIASLGKIKYLPEVMSAYRVHAGGIWSSKSQMYKEKENIKFYTLLQEHFAEDKDTLKAIVRKKKYVYYSISRKLVLSKQRLKSFCYMLRSINLAHTSHPKINYFIYFKEFVKSVIK